MIEKKPILFLDGSCVICNALGTRLLKIDKTGQILLSTLTGEAADRARLEFSDFPSGMDTVVFVENGQLYVRSDAILKMVKHLPFPHSLPGIFIWTPRFLRDFFYDIIARNRKKWFGSTEMCSLISAPQDQILP